MLGWKLCAVFVGAVLWSATVARAEDGPQVIVVGEGQAEGVAAAGEVQSDYWIGLHASPPSPVVQAQLKLPNDQGLVVEDVQPQSPAAKAGIQQYDILLKGNDKPLANLGDLVRVIDQVKNGKLTLDLLRDGKHVSVTVTPAKRPASEMGGPGFDFGPGLAPGGPLEFRIIHRGQILPPGGPLPTPPDGATTMEIIIRATTKLADGTQVEITRHGAEPAKIVVTRGKEKWEGTSGDLSKIPEKIRPEVEKLLHPVFDHMRVLATGYPLAGRGPAGGAVPPPLPGGGNVIFFNGAARGLPGLPGPILQVQPDVEKRLCELQKQVNKLRQSVEALKIEAAKKPAAKPE